MEIIQTRPTRAGDTGVGWCGHFEGGCGRPYLSEVTGFSFAVGDEQNQQREWPEGEIGLRGQSLALGLTLIAAPQLGEGSRLNVEWLR